MTDTAEIWLTFEPLQQPLSAAQLRFMRFHHEHMVEKWSWHFLNSQLRARATVPTATVSRNETATIWRRELDELIGRGLMFKGMGVADVHLTDAGRAAI